MRFRHEVTMVRRKSKRAARVVNIELKKEKTMANFKIGDTVRLKSGGPAMTVSGIESLVPGSGGRWQVACVWFAELKVETSAFPFECVEPASASH